MGNYTLLHDAIHATSLLLFHQDATEPDPNVFTFDAGDQIVDIALANGYIFRGHNLGGKARFVHLYHC